MIVSIETRSVGQHFATVGIVRAINSRGRKGRILAEAADVRPYGFTGPALEDARQIAESNGWTVVD